MMQWFKTMSSTLAILMLVSCVTINIYFPEAAAEKAADRIIEDVWGKDGRPPATESQSDDTAEPQSSRNNDMPVALKVLNWLVSPAHAQADLNINSPAINALKDKMKARHEQLQPFYQSGAIGLTEDGLIALHDAKAVPLKDRNTINALIAEENKDRNALYAEIARANDHPEWQPEIQQTFAERWREKAPAGWWYQQGGSWQQK